MSQGGGAVVACIENLRLDVQFRFSRKPEFLQNTLPCRANELAQRFATTLQCSFVTSDDTGQSSVPSTSRQYVIPSKKWIPSLQTVFLGALNLVVRLRQRKHPIEFFWPMTGEAYDDARMQAENNGTRADLLGKKVLLSLVPAAYSRVPIDEKPGELEELMPYKATVVLDMEGM
jgi:hypothetical protein